MQFSANKGLQIVLQLIWHQGLRQPETRKQFCQQLWIILRQKPQVLNMYLGLCAAGEHFREYCDLARQRITELLGYDPLQEVAKTETLPVLVES